MWWVGAFMNIDFCYKNIELNVTKCKFQQLYEEIHCPKAEKDRDEIFDESPRAKLVEKEYEHLLK